MQGFVNKESRQGFLNKAIHSLSIENFGNEKWEEIKLKSNIDEDLFLCDPSYPGEYIYQFVVNASEIIGIPTEKKTHNFGTYWSLKIGEKHYGPMAWAAGKDISQFILYLAHLHSRFMLFYSNIKAPEFLVSQSAPHLYQINPYSVRSELKPFDKVQLSGISKMYCDKSSIELLIEKISKGDLSIFEIKIIE